MPWGILGWGSILCENNYSLSVKIYHYRANRIHFCMHDNLSTQKKDLGLDERKFCSTKISMFTVL